jgi:pSer/pThr/pTyr-binding forkhead associated (FHA) protein
VRVDDHAISRHHCLIVTNDRHSVIEDLNSINGVVFKGKRVRLHNLNDGDVVSLGSHQLMYTDERGGSRPSPDIDTADTGPHAKLA